MQFKQQENQTSIGKKKTMTGELWGYNQATYERKIKIICVKKTTKETKAEIFTNLEKE